MNVQRPIRLFEPVAAIASRAAAGTDAANPIQFSVLVLYDEPSSGLDPARAEQIQDLIGNVHHRQADVGVGRTTVIVTHDAGLLSRLKPRIIMLNS